MSLRTTTSDVASRQPVRRSGSAKMHALLLSVVLVLLCGNLLRLQSAFFLVQAKPQVLATTPTQSQSAQAVAPTLPTAGGSGQGGQSTAQITTPQACTGSRFTMPAALAITSLPAGLTKQIDSPTYYQVYGSSISELRSAVENCPLRAASGNFHAETAYGLNWSYSTIPSGNVCALSDVRVALHVSQYFPLFVPTSTTPATVRSMWSTYATNLRTHENGHTAIDTTYAQSLTTALQQLTVSDCSSIDQRVQTTVNSYVAALNAANVQYDSQTDHGATQGAVL